MKQDFQFRMKCMNVNADLMKVYIIQSKNWIMMNVDVNVITR